MKKEFQMQRLSVLFFITFVFLVIAVGFQAIAVTDDYWLATYVLKKGKPFISPFTWAFDQYFFWSGQLINHFLQGLFTFKPAKTNFTSGLHALIFVGASLTWILRFYKNYEEDRMNRLSFGAVLLTGFFIFTFSVLGLSVYIAASTIIWSYLFFMLAYAIFSSELFEKYHFLRYVVFFCAGNSSDSVLIPLLLLFFLNRKNEKFPLLKKYFIVFMVGVLLNICAPSTLGHLRMGVSNLPLNPVDYLYRIYKIMMTIVELVGWRFFFFLPLCFCFQVSSSMNPSDLKKATMESLALFCGAVFLFLFANGPVDNSYYFFALIFFSLTVFWSVQLLKRRILQMRMPEWIQHFAVFLGLLGCIEVLGENFINAARVRVSFMEQLAEIDYQSSAHTPITASAHMIPMEKHILYYEDITKNKEDMSNQARREYYEVESVVAK